MAVKLALAPGARACRPGNLGRRQLRPGELPTFKALPPQVPQGQFAVAIHLDERDSMHFPIGAQGAAAIYTTGGGFTVLRRISIRARTWLNWLYPMPF